MVLILGSAVLLFDHPIRADSSREVPPGRAGPGSPAVAEVAPSVPGPTREASPGLVIRDRRDGAPLSGVTAYFYAEHRLLQGPLHSDSSGAIVFEETSPPADAVFLMADGFVPEYLAVGARELFLEPGALALGRVIDGSGRGVPDVMVQADYAGLPAFLSVSASSEADGAFRLACLPCDQRIRVVAATNRPGDGDTLYCMTPPRPGERLEGLTLTIAHQVRCDVELLGVRSDCRYRVQVRDHRPGGRGALLGSREVAGTSHLSISYRDPPGEHVEFSLLLSGQVIDSAVVARDMHRARLDAGMRGLVLVTLRDRGTLCPEDGLFWVQRDPQDHGGSVEPGRVIGGRFAFAGIPGEQASLAVWLPSREDLRVAVTLQPTLELPAPPRATGNITVQLAGQPASGKTPARVIAQRKVTLGGCDLPASHWVRPPDAPLTQHPQTATIEPLPAGHYEMQVLDHDDRVLGRSPWVELQSGERRTVQICVAPGILAIEPRSSGTEGWVLLVDAAGNETRSAWPGPARIEVPPGRYQATSTCQGMEEVVALQLEAGELERMAVGPDRSMDLVLWHECGRHGDADHLGIRGPRGAAGEVAGTISSTLFKERDGGFHYRGTAGVLEVDSPCGRHVVESSGDGVPVELGCALEVGILVRGTCATEGQVRLVFRSAVDDRSPGREREVALDEWRRFEVRLPRPGRYYVIQVLEDSLVPQLHDLEDGDDLVLDEPLERLDLTVHRGDDRPAAGLRVVVHAPLDELGGVGLGLPATLPVAAATTGAEGRVRLGPLRPGRYLVDVDPEGEFASRHEVVLNRGAGAMTVKLSTRR